MKLFLRTLLPLALISAQAADAQRLYNAPQDQQATAALELARQLAAASPFDKAVANLGELQKLANEDIFRSGRLLMRAEMGAWRTWDDLELSLGRFETALNTSLGSPEDFKREIAEAKEKERVAQSELAELAKKLTENPTAASLNLAGAWMERIGKVKPLADYLLGLEQDEAAKGPNVKAAGQAKEALDRLAQLYQGFRLDLPKQPGQLFLESQLQALELEVQHLENLIGIQQRLDRELKEIRTLLQSTKKWMQLVKPRFPGKTIQESLDAEAAAARQTPSAQPVNLSQMLSLLYEASALAARNHTPVRLAEQRESLEQRAHSLRQAGSSSAAYQALIVNGLQRLSLYYKGGIRPNTIADLIQAFATVGVIPAILAK